MSVNAKVHNWEAIDEESEELFVHIPDNDAPDLGKASLTDENGRRDLVEIAIGRKPFYDFEIVGKEQADQNDPELRLEAGLRQIWSKEESLFSGASNDFGIVAILQRIWYRALEGASREYRVDGEMYYGMSVQGGGEPDSPSGNLDDLDKVQFREKVHAPQVGKKKTKDQKKWAYIVDFPREKPFSDVHGWEAAWFGEKRGEKAWAVGADQMFHYRTSRLDLRGVVPESGFHIEKAAFVDERSDASRTCWSLTVTKHAEAVTIDGESTEAGLLEGGSEIRETFEIPCADPKEKKKKKKPAPEPQPEPQPEPEPTPPSPTPKPKDPRSADQRSLANGAYDPYLPYLSPGEVMIAEGYAFVKKDLDTIREVILVGKDAKAKPIISRARVLVNGFEFFGDGAYLKVLSIDPFMTGTGSSNFVSPEWKSDRDVEVPEIQEIWPNIDYLEGQDESE